MPAKKSKKSKAETQREAILVSLESGSSRVAACAAASVGRSTFYDWLEKDEGFRMAVEAVERALIETVEFHLGPERVKQIYYGRRRT